MKRSKKAQSLTTMIILALVLVVTIALFARMYTLAKDEGIRGQCTLESIKGSVTGIDKKFWSSYELKCRAQTTFMSEDELLKKTVSDQLAKDAGYTKSGSQLEPREKKDALLKQMFGQKIQNCWDITGNRKVFSEYEDFMPSKVGDVKGEVEKFRPLDSDSNRQAIRNELLTKYLGPDVSYNAINGLTVCMVCSTIYFDDDLIDFGKGQYYQGPTLSAVGTQDTYQLANYLQTVPSKNNAKKSLMSEIAEGKETKYKFPMYISTSEPQSVAHIQWFSNAGGMTKQDISRTAVIVVPTQDVANVCDLVVNQI